MRKRVFLVVLDGVGCGELPDAASFKDAGANTLGNCSRAVGGLRLPVLQSLGLGNITVIDGVPPTDNPSASWGKLTERSVMKDTPTGHGEMMGIVTTVPWAFFPNGFPKELLDEFCEVTGVKGVLGNKAISGTEIIKEFGQEHERTGWPIVYTSGDSVLQVAAHKDVIPLDLLNAMCAAARPLCDKRNIGRVISRPFIGKWPNYERTKERHDWGKPMPDGHLLDQLVARIVPIFSLGKIGDIFGHRSTGCEIKTGHNEAGLSKLTQLMCRLMSGFVFANLLDTDDECGHRRDPQKFAKCLEEIDAWLGAIIPVLREDDTLILTADHGNDPTFAAHTDHTREHVPLIVVNPGGSNVDLGVRRSFADIGATIADIFNVSALAAGESFLRSIQR